MKIVIPGGSGHVGTLLARAFHAEGHEVVVLTRSPRTAPWRVILWDAEGLARPIILAAPNPLPNAAFLAALRDAAGVHAGLPAAAWMLEIGARALGTETELILKSRYVVPRRLLEAGFTFEFPTWLEAARDLCRSAGDLHGVFRTHPL